VDGDDGVMAINIWPNWPNCNDKMKNSAKIEISNCICKLVNYRTDLWCVVVW
jgi:hypothetical protein